MLIDLYRQADFTGSRNRLHAGTNTILCCCNRDEGRLKTFQTAFLFEQNKDYGFTTLPLILTGSQFQVVGLPSSV